MNRDGSSPRVLAGDLDRSAGSPRWTGDGSGVFFLYDNHGHSRLAVATMDGKVRTVADGLGGRGSAYGGASYSVSLNGRFAMNHTTPSVPGDIAVGNLSGPLKRVITHVNRDLLGHKSLGNLENIWYESSKDGRKIQGWIIKPPHFDPTRKYPLILAIHGGPFANYGDRFDLEMQIWAAKDYVIFYANPRGSTSYGEEFGNLIHHAYPGDDFFDLDAGVDAVIAKGYVDPEQLFVTGGSGGGVLTCWMIGRTDRFGAAGDQLVQLHAHGRSVGVFLQVLVPRPAVGSHRALHEPLTAVGRRQRQDPNDGHHRRGGLANADLGIRAVLQSSETTQS